MANAFIILGEPLILRVIRAFNRLVSLVKNFIQVWLSAVTCKFGFPINPLCTDSDFSFMVTVASRFSSPVNVKW